MSCPIHLSFTDFNLKITYCVLILIFKLKSVNDTFITQPFGNCLSGVA